MKIFKHLGWVMRVLKQNPFANLCYTCLWYLYNCNRIHVELCSYRWSSVKRYKVRIVILRLRAVQ